MEITPANPLTPTSPPAPAAVVDPLAQKVEELGLSATLQRLNYQLDFLFPPFIAAQKAPVEFFQMIVTEIHKRAQEKNIDEPPPSKLTPEKTLEWECAHIEALAWKVEMDQWVQDIEKGEVKEIDEKSKRLLNRLATLPSFRTTHSEKLALISKYIDTLPDPKNESALLLAKVIRTPYETLQLSDGQIPVDSALLALYSGLFRDKYLSPMEKSAPLDLTSFSSVEIAALISLIQNPKVGRIKAEDLLRNLYLADYLRSDALERVCIETLSAVMGDLDLEDPEERALVLEFFNVPFLTKDSPLSAGLRGCLLSWCFKSSPDAVNQFFSQIQPQTVANLGQFNLRNLNDVQVKQLALQSDPLQRLFSVTLCLRRTDHHFMGIVDKLDHELEFNTLENVQDLQKFSLVKGVEVDGVVVDNDFLKNLSPKLESLGLTRCNITNVSLSHLTNLKSLGLPGLDITNESLEKLPLSLESLDLWCCSTITDATSLSRLKDLKALNLGNTAISQASLEALPPSIESLNLSGCHNVTDASSLLNLPHLKVLTVHRGFLSRQLEDKLRGRGIKIGY